MLVELTAADFLRYLTWVVFGLIGLWSLVQAVRRPTSVNIDVALLFGGLTLAIIGTVLVRLGLLANTRMLQLVITTGVLAMPYLLIRLMNDVVGISRRVLWGSTVAFTLALVLFWLLNPIPPLIALLIVAALVVMLGYVVVVGIWTIRSARGITRRRLIAVTLGTVFLAFNFSVGSLPAILPISPNDVRSLNDIFGLAAGLCYLVGFVPPRWLRRFWQAPELRRFLEQATRLPMLQDSPLILHELEQGAAAALGAPYASVGMWDPQSQDLRFTTLDPPVILSLKTAAPATRAFVLKQAVFSRNTPYDSSPDSLRFRDIARAVLAAPIMIGERALGVLVVYAPRAPIFAEDDMALAQVLADQAAIVLETRRLNEAAARTRAREEAAHLKEDFLSTAAHDLKTPLTSLVLQAQQLARRAKRQPDAPVDQVGLDRMVRESERLRALVVELLDSARAQHAPLVASQEPFDLAAAVHTLVQRHASEHHSFQVEAPASLVGLYDGRRITQVLDNLVDNAIKYSPAGGTITIRLWQDESDVHLTVTDQGIGIPPADIPYLFHRFHRGSNVDDRRFPGWGLGLSICRKIAQEHGGQMTVESSLGIGTTFLVLLPSNYVIQEQHVTLDSRD